MTLVIEPAYRELLHDVVEDMYRFRHRIFVGMLGWTDIAREDGRDVDAYDHEHAVYFATVEDGEVVACSRLVPSLTPNICATQFPQHANLREIPRRPDIYDYSRFAVAADKYGPVECNRLKAMQVASVFDYCVRRSITSCISFTLAHTLPQYVEMGIKTTPLGLPVTIGDSTYVSVHFETTAQAYAKVLALFGMKGSPLIDPAAAGDRERANFTLDGAGAR